MLRTIDNTSNALQGEVRLHSAHVAVMGGECEQRALAFREVLAVIPFIYQLVFAYV